VKVPQAAAERRGEERSRTIPYYSRYIMGVGEDFANFCSNIAVKDRETIASRYQLITRRLNTEFWNTESYTAHSLYLGSFGRGTATGLTSDIDLLFQLPWSLYLQYDAWAGNGQSGLLQAVRAAIQKTYPSTGIGADGQVVVVRFGDGTHFEVLPAFENSSGSFTYPDANAGGSWKITNPKPEIAAIDARDAVCNSNLKRLGRMARAWKAQWDAPISGLLIDTLAYNFLGSWEHREKSYLYYDFMSRDFFRYLADRSESQDWWASPGAGQYVWRTGKFEYKSVQCYNLALEAITYAANNETWSARRKWRDIYGTSYPS
jgi:hypothetical protein